MLQLKKYCFIMCCLILVHGSILAQSSKVNQPDKNTSPTDKTLEERVAILENQVKELQEKLNIATSNQSTTTKKETITTVQKPNDETVKSVIGLCIKQRVPVTWAGNLMGGRNGNASSVTIIQWGNFNDQYKYWPIKARVVGTCIVDNFTTSETKSFDKTGDFKVKMDDYGNWTADLDAGF